MEIRLNSVCKSYFKNKRELKIIENFSYVFRNSKMYLIKGSSGAGKTTLLSIIGLLDKPDSGLISFDDRDLFNLSYKERTDFIHKNIGFIFQDYNLLEGLTIEENILIHYLGYKGDLTEEKQRIEAILKRLGLLHRKNHYPFELSGGEKQRVGIARALVKQPKLIICDEPISNLDKDNSEQIKNILIELKKSEKCTIIVSCHTEDFDKIVDETIKLG